MKQNFFFDLDRIWETSSVNEKIRVLQAFENECAKIQYRQPRAINYVPQLNLTKTNNQTFTTQASFDADMPNYLNLYQLISPSKALESICHEAYHSMFFDYVKNRNNIKLFGSFNKDRYSFEFTNTQKIHFLCLCQKAKQLFDIKFYEEELVRRESNMFLFDYLVSKCENDNDIINSMVFFLNMFQSFVSAEELNKYYKSIGIDYDKIIADMKLSAEKNNNNPSLYTQKLVFANSNKECVIAFNKCCELFKMINAEKNEHKCFMIFEEIKRIIKGYKLESLKHQPSSN